MATFWYHYNKPASLKFGTPKLTVHHRGVCYIVDKIECYTNTWSHNRNTQPRVVIKGKAKQFTTKTEGGKTIAICE